MGSGDESSSSSPEISSGETRATATQMNKFHVNLSDVTDAFVAWRGTALDQLRG